ncbi:MAG: 3-hydroxybutyryl-CoA dehydrogenase [Ignavibacteriaceae bacterium]|nr:3-hydroxybutyryl-CoA dehydrogenase [Ignavibacteriaceae bacterium]
MKTVAVIGSGTMGSGIAHVFAIKGFPVTLIDNSENALQKARKNIENNLDRQIKKGIIDETLKNSALQNLELKIGLKNISKDTDLIVEAIFEDKNLKSLLFSELNNLIKENSIFASNTSAISITELSTFSRPENFIGMHFMNPVPIMKLVEIVKGYSTSLETIETIKELTLFLDKTPVIVNDFPGFVSNRILMPMINEAIYALMEGVSSAEEIDTVFKLGMNHPMGPLTLADFIGLDVCLAIMNVLYEGFNDSKYRACPLLKKMVAAKKLGKKVGEGFYKYE